MNFLKKYAKFFTVALIGAIIIQSAAIPVFADETDTVYLGGQPFGVKFFSDGVMVVELEDFYNNGRYICPARDGGLEINDVIKEINGQTVRTNEDVQRVIFQCGGEPLKLTVERGGKEFMFRERGYVTAAPASGQSPSMTGKTAALRRSVTESATMTPRH